MIAPEDMLDEETQFNLLAATAGVTYEDVVAELRYRIERRARESMQLQHRAAAVNGTRRILRQDDVGGEVDFQIAPYFYHWWGQRYGYECWDDRQFVREMKRDNPEIRVKTVSDRVTIVNPGLPDKAGPRRFRGVNPRYLVNGKPTTREDRLTIGGIKVPR